MSSDEDGWIAVAKGSDIASIVPLWNSDEWVRSETDPAKVFSKLLANEQWGDALRLMPYLLPIRRGVWFGCLCAWLARNDKANPREEESLRTAVLWVRQPSADHHRMARQIADAYEEPTIASSCLQAACWAGYREANGTWINSDPVMASRFCVSAIMNTLAESDNYEAIFPLQLLAIGIEVSQGKSLW